MVRVRSNRHFTYLESTLQHQRHKIRKAPSRPNFSYLSGYFSSCVTCNVMVNIAIIKQTPQNFQERQKRRDRQKLNSGLVDAWNLDNWTLELWTRGSFDSG